MLPAAPPAGFFVAWHNNEDRPSKGPVSHINLSTRDMWCYHGLARSSDLVNLL